MSRYDLDLWPLDLELLQHFGCHAFKLCTKFEQNRIIHHCVIDDLARFRRAILEVGYFCPTVLKGVWTQLHQTWRGHRAIIPAQDVCFSIRIFRCIFKDDRFKFEWCWKRRQISHSLTPVKSMGRVGEISIPIVEALRTPNLQNTFDGHPLRGCWARWIDKRETKKEKVHGQNLTPSRLTSGGLYNVHG